MKIIHSNQKVQIFENTDLCQTEKFSDSLGEPIQDDEDVRSGNYLVDIEEPKPCLNASLELDIQIEEKMEKTAGMWQCKVCSKTSKLKSNLKNHIETHIEGNSHPCHVCNKILLTRISLRMHYSKNHSGTSF